MSAPQSFNNHAKRDPMFQFVLIPLCFLLLLGSMRALVRHHDLLHLGLLLMVAAILMTATKTRLYALKNQDRIIRLEEKTRLYRLMPNEPTLIESLSIDQCVGLRFASDTEVSELARRSVRENLSRKQIKQAVTQWRADNDRI